MDKENIFDKKHTEHSRKEILDILYQNLPSVCDVTKDKEFKNNKYVVLARENRYNNYRLLILSDLIKYDVFQDFTQYQREFFKENGIMLAIFNTLSGNITSVVFRAINSKAFMDYSLYYCCYGLDMIPEGFKYGDWLLITEGIFDADTVRTIYPKSIAMLTSNISIAQADIIKTVTNKFIVAFDNDNAGDSGLDKAYKRLTGCVVEPLKVYPDDKDLGCMEEIRQENRLSDYKERIEYYKNMIESMIR